MQKLSSETIVSDHAKCLSGVFGRPEIRCMCSVVLCVAGNRFDIREFHEEILRLGPVPLHVLELAVYRWIRTQSGRGTSAAIAPSSALMSAAAAVLTLASFWPVA